VKRFIDTLKSILKKLAAEKKKDWERFVDPALFSYRFCVQASFGFTLFTLMYGRKVFGPMDILKSLWTKEGTSEEVRMTYQYVLDLKEKIAETCKLAAAESDKAAERTKFYYNKHAKKRSFVPGDRVVLLLSTHSSKLLLAWKGPFEVVEKGNDPNYKNITS